MTFQCPGCQRSFIEPGFCPYDGKPLIKQQETQKPTLLSEMLPAQSAPVTVGEPADDTGKIRALSAGAGTTNILALLREQVSEYDQLVGETLDGRYYVQRKIGEGGMGVVFAAKHAVIERPLAIKVLKREVMRDTATIKRFVQEAKAASRIGHPNIVDVTDFGTTPEGMTYSVMEYVDGVTLSKAIKEHAPFPPERSIRIAMQIARALGAAHDKGIVHRDLKPENVFLIDRDERPDFVKIVDFGIAKVQPIEGASTEPRLTRAGSVFGTPEYMAPEQAAGRGDTDGRVDIYALGTILYEMTCGRTPFKSDSMVRTIAMQMLDPIVPPSKVNPDRITPALEVVIMKALEKKREDRYATMGDVLVALDGVSVALAAAAAAPTKPPPLLLPALPPGADGSPTPPTIVAPPRRAKPETRQVHEPEFVSAGPVVMPQPPYVDDEAEPPRARRWPMAVVAVLLIGGGGAGALYLAARSNAPVIALHEDGRTRSDATLIAEAIDAAVTRDDGGTVITAMEPDGGLRAALRDGGVATIPGPPSSRIVTIEILTRPGDAGVFVGHDFRGPSSVHLSERYGTVLTIDCKAPHYKGTIKVVFDGTRDAVMCVAQHLKMCVKGIHNPFEHCEEDTDTAP